MALGNGDRSRRKLVGYVALILVVAIAATIAFYSIYQSPSAASTGVARTVTVTRGTVQSSVSASGNTSAVTSADEDFDNSGTLTAVNVAVGDKVTAGQVLATIDSTQAEANLQSAQASLAGAQTTLAHDQAGGTPAQQAQNQATLVSAQQQLTSDQNQLTSDQTSLQTAQSTYSADQALGCPASTSSSSSGTSSAAGSGSTGGTTGSTPSVECPIRYRPRMLRRDPPVVPGPHR